LPNHPCYSLNSLRLPLPSILSTGAILTAILTAVAPSHATYSNRGVAAMASLEAIRRGSSDSFGGYLAQWRGLFRRMFGAAATAVSGANSARRRQLFQRHPMRWRRLLRWRFDMTATAASAEIWRRGNGCFDSDSATATAVSVGIRRGDDSCLDGDSTRRRRLFSTAI
jgi:hypothetical protein